MANTPVFSILCCVQMVIGFLIFGFGLVDRIGIQMQISFLMLPVWNGILVGVAGLTGLIIGRQNKRQGCAGSEAASALRAINTVCIGLSFLSFYQYGVVLSYIGWRVEMDYTSNWSGNFPTTLPFPPKQRSPYDGSNDDDTRQGVLSIIMILSLLEMFIGAWLAMFEKEKMVFGSTQSQDQVPLIGGQHTQYVQQSQFAQPNTAFSPVVIATPQVQQQQQPVYVMAQHGLAPMPAQQVVMAPTNQQQPSYVVMQPSAAMATSQPQMMRQPQQQYIAVENPPQGNVTVPTNLPPEHQGLKTDSPAPQSTADV